MQITPRRDLSTLLKRRPGALLKAENKCDGLHADAVNLQRLELQGCKTFYEIEVLH